MYHMVRIREVVSATPWLILAMTALANAACECGYSVNRTSDATHAVFTDLMENDFLHTAGDNFTKFGWQPQEYNVSAEDARGPFGKEFWVENAVLNPLKDPRAWSGEGEKEGDAGLQLWVRGDHSHGFITGAELASVRHDALYGSFRVSMKLAGQNGTCGAFFWFYNNSQEIDMEFLSKQFDSSGGLVNLVLQSPASVRAGYNAADTPNYHVHPLPFRPDDAFHEYRFDWSPDRVTFFVDGQYMYEMTENIPTSAGRFFMNHWSNGDPLWSAGPPLVDTPMTVSYVKAYFNSTDEARGKSHEKFCPKWDGAKVCRIPELREAAPAHDAGTYFFSADGGDKTPGQITFRRTNAGGRLGFGVGSLSAMWVAMLSCLASWVVY